jgi:uncharacterized protein (UPF0276 family)
MRSQERSTVLPKLGTGLGYRLPLSDAISRHKHLLGWVEIHTDQFLPCSPAREEYLQDHLPDLPRALHGTELSIASMEPLDLDYIRAVARLAHQVCSRWVSDHLCFTRSKTRHLGHLTPTVWTSTNARRIAERVRQIQDIIELPFLLENIAFDFTLPGEQTEADFISQVVTDAKCGLLLDVTNVFANSVNHHFDPYQFILELPLEAVQEIHIAGGQWREGVLADSHDATVDQGTWDLLEFVLDRCPVGNVLLERDDNFPTDFQELGADLSRATEILRRRTGSRDAQWTSLP